MIIKNISRRKFLLIAINSSFLSFFIFYREKKSANEISQGFRDEINAYNLKRIEFLKNNLVSAIKNDLNNDKTLWVGRKLITFAEVSFL